MKRIIWLAGVGLALGVTSCAPHVDCGLSGKPPKVMSKRYKAALTERDTLCNQLNRKKSELETQKKKYERLSGWQGVSPFPLCSSRRSGRFRAVRRPWMAGSGSPAQDVTSSRPPKKAAEEGSRRNAATCGMGAIFFDYFLCSHKESNPPPGRRKGAGGEPRAASKKILKKLPAPNADHQ